MNIYFLGTSHGYAEKNRFTSATLIEVEGNCYLIDAGAPVEALMANLGKPYQKMRSVFITHMHSDHVGNLTSVIEPMLSYRKTEGCSCFMPCQSGLDGFVNWLQTLHVKRDIATENIRFGVSFEGLIYEDGIVKVYAVPTKHFAPENGAPASWSYVIEAEGKRIMFTGDMAGGFPELEDTLKGLSLDLLVCEMAHADLTKVWPVLLNADKKQLIINHYHVPKLNGMDRCFAQADFPVKLAYDGLKVCI